MIIKALLAFGLLLPLFYVMIQSRRRVLVRGAVMLTVVFGQYFVWFPEEANRIAGAVDVGRGADLLLYSWVLIGMLLILNSALSIISINETLTKLIRHIAIQEAVSDADNRQRLR